MAIKRFFNVLDAPEVEDLGIRFETPIQWQTDFPGTGEHLGIFNRGLIADRVRAYWRVALHNVHRIAMKVSGPVKPRVRRKVRHLNDQSISVPAANRISHVSVAGIGIDLIDADGPLGVSELENHHDLVRSLKDLERLGKVNRTGHTRL